MSRILLLTLLSIFVLRVQSQQWYPSDVNPSSLSFEQHINYFEEYWQTNEIKKGKGYKQFLRWAHIQKERLQPNGEPQKALYTLSELQRFEKENAKQTKRNANINWQSLGPDSSEGGYSGIGRVNCMGFHPSDPNTYWIGTPIGGLWKTTDDGRTWSCNTDMLPNLGVSDILVHPQNPDIIYIATGDADGGARDNASIGVLKSIDGGQTWTQAQPVFQVNQGLNIYRMIMNPNNPNHIVLATSAGVFRSTDGLNSAQRTFTDWFCDVEFHPTNPNIVYAATFGSNSIDGLARLYVSTDGGTNWTMYFQYDNSASEFSVDRINIGVTPSRPNGFYALASHRSAGFHSVVYFEGNNFDLILSGDVINLLNWEEDGDPSDPTGQGWYDLSFTVNPANPNEMYVGGVNSWKIVNRQPQIVNYWYLNSFNIPVIHADKHNFYYHPLRPQRLFECNDGGIYYSDNAGQSWTDISNGLVISQIYKISVSALRAGDVMTGLQDNGSKNLENGSWRDVSGGDGMQCLIDPSNPNIKYSSIYNALAINRTTDNWQNQRNIMENHPERGKGAWVTPFMLHPNEPSTIFIAMTKVWRSNNRGDSWQEISPVLSSNEKIIHLSVSPVNPQIIYAATNTKLFITSNGGGSWTQIGSTTNTSPITNIKADPTDANTIYVCYGGYVSSQRLIVSNNRGSSFSSIGFNLPNIPALDIEIHKETGDMYVGTDLGVFYKGKDDQSWERYGNLLPNTMVRDIEIAYNEGFVYASTYGRGLWKAPIANVGAGNLIVSPSVLTFPDAPAGCQQINIVCNPDERWSISYHNADGSFDIVESITPQSGVGPGVVTVCSNVNRLPIAIGGVMGIFLENSNDFSVVLINQLASEAKQLRVYKEPSLYTQDSSFIAPYLGGDIRAFILTNASFEPASNIQIAAHDRDWLSVKSTNATAFAPFRLVVFEAKQNNSILNRYARVRLSYNNGQDSTFIFINQPSKNSEYLNVSPLDLTLLPWEYTATDNIVINLKTDLAWTAQVSGHDGLNINAQSGSGDRRISLTLSENTQIDEISGLITFTATKSDGSKIIREVRIKQLSQREKLSEDPGIVCFPNPSSGEFAIYRQDGFDNCYINIIDQAGRIVYTEMPSINMNREALYKKLNLSHLTAGTYFMQLIDRGKSSTKQLVIVK